jgi:hypothetical protein
MVYELFETQSNQPNSYQLGERLKPYIVRRHMGDSRYQQFVTDGGTEAAT